MILLAILHTGGRQKTTRNGLFTMLLSFDRMVFEQHAMRTIRRWCPSFWLGLSNAHDAHVVRMWGAHPPATRSVATCHSPTETIRPVSFFMSFAHKRIAHKMYPFKKGQWFHVMLYMCVYDMTEYDFEKGICALIHFACLFTAIFQRIFWCRWGPVSTTSQTTRTTSWRNGNNKKNFPIRQVFHLFLFPSTFIVFNFQGWLSTFAAVLNSFHCNNKFNGLRCVGAVAALHPLPIHFKDGQLNV